jgi:hypothetical protein
MEISSAAETRVKPLDRAVARISCRPSKVRSSVTNGYRAFIRGDGNSSWYRRMKDIAEMHADDLGAREDLSQAQLSLCRRAAVLEVELERLEGQLSLDMEIDMDVYNRIAGNLRRILESIGLDRKPRIAPEPSLYEIAAAVADGKASRRGRVAPVAAINGSAATHGPETKEGASCALPDASGAP